MESPVTPTRSTAYLLAQLSLRLIDVWEETAPAAYQCAIPPLDLGPLVSFVRLHTDTDRQQRLHAMTTLVTWLTDGITPHLSALEDAPRARAQTLLHALTKVIADDLMTDAEGQWVERPTKQRGEHRLASAVDLDATFRKHEGSPAVLGTNAVISVTPTRIRAAVALTGSIPDGEAPSAALQQQRDADLPLPPQIVMDQAGGWGKTRARVIAVSDGQTEMVARIPVSGGRDPNRFSVADFQVDAERTTCTCPGGVVSTKAYRSGNGDGVDFRFLASQCAGCAEWAGCRDPNANPKGHRSVFISDYHPLLRAGAIFNETPLGRSLLGGRWRVEPGVAWLTRYQGCRRARRIGTAAAQSQLSQACAMRNLLMWLSRIRRGLAPRPPRC